VGDSDDCDVALELRPKRCLNYGVGLVVNRGRCFVKHKQLALPHYRARQRNDLWPVSCDVWIHRRPAYLSLSNAEVPSARYNRAVEGKAILVRVRLQGEQSGRT
jgi:hypothetical protein